MSGPDRDAAGPAMPAQPDRIGRAIGAFGRRNVAYLCSTMAAAATVPAFDALESASGTLGPDRLGGEVGSVLLWGVGSLLFLGWNALEFLEWLIRGNRTRTALLHAAIGCALPSAVLLAGTVGVSLQDALTSPPAGLVTHELAAPATIGGITFPAGSVVETGRRPPGRVVRGYVAAPTVIGGLTVIGDFELVPDGSGAVWKGRLAEAQPVDTVPCAPGVFHRDGGSVECTLAEPVAVNGATLAAGEQAGIDPGRGGAPARLGFGVLAGSASIGGLKCAPGPVQASDRWTGCVLARDQEIGGLWLMGGTNALVIHEENGSTRVEDGAVLARPLEAFGLTLPRGTILLRFPSTRPEELREGYLPNGVAVGFRIPDNASVPVLDGEVQGRMEIKLDRDGIEVSSAYRGSRGIFLLDGHRVRGARFDRRQGAWQIYSTGD